MKDFLLKNIANYVVKPVLTKYLQSTRTFTFRHLTLQIPPSVFHPAFFFSTKYMLQFADSLALENKTVGEPGAGSGLISLWCFHKKANVYAWDINETAVSNLKSNFEKNYGSVSGFQVFQSDVFDNVPEVNFDFLFINPPYFFNTPATPTQMAWYAGKEGEYFHKLFSSLNSYTTENSEVYMILADNCDLEKIMEIAAVYNWSFTEVSRKKIWWEHNFIYRIQQKKG